MFRTAYKIKQILKYIIQFFFSFLVIEKIPKNCKFIQRDNTFWGYYDELPVLNNCFIYHNYKSTKFSTPPQIVEIFCGSKKIPTKQKIITTNVFSFQFGSRIIISNKKLFLLNSFKNKIVTEVFDEDFKLIGSLNYSLFKIVGKYHIAVDVGKYTLHDPDYSFFKDKNLVQYKKYSHPVSFYLADGSRDDSWFHREIKKLKLENNYCCTHFISKENKMFFIIRTKHPITRDYLCFVDFEERKVKVFSYFTKISHFCFYKNTIFIYGKSVQYNWGYFNFNYSKENATFIRKGYDGHPVAIKNKIYIDSYPRLLPIINFGVFSFNPIIKIRHKPTFASYYRTDFHPRFVKRQNIIYFDSARFGRRVCGFFDM